MPRGSVTFLFVAVQLFIANAFDGDMVGLVPLLLAGLFADSLIANGKYRRWHVVCALVCVLRRRRQRSQRLAMAPGNLGWCHFLWCLDRSCPAPSTQHRRATRDSTHEPPELTGRDASCGGVNESYARINLSMTIARNTTDRYRFDALKNDIAEFASRRRRRSSPNIHIPAAVLATR